MSAFTKTHISRASFASRALAPFAALLALACEGCALWVYDDPCGPPPTTYCVAANSCCNDPVCVEGGCVEACVEGDCGGTCAEAVVAAPCVAPVRVVTPVPAPVVVPVATPGTYFYTPAPYPVYTSAPFYRGQVPDEEFPALDESFPSVGDVETPPESSEIAEFAFTGANVPEPTGNYEKTEYDDDTFRPQPTRESLAEREKKEEELEKNFNDYRKRNSRSSKSADKTPRYLKPIEDSNADFSRALEERFAREAQQDKKDGLVSTVTYDTIELLTDTEESKRELYDWEKEQEESNFISRCIENSYFGIRNWLGMGSDERKALSYMRQAVLKQKEYAKTKDKDLLKDAAELYEKAAKRWPGPALNATYVKKHPFQAPKSGTLIEEDGLFFAAECWFFYGDFVRAYRCYKMVVATYTSSIYKATATKRLYYIGCYSIERSEGGVSTGEKTTNNDVQKHYLMSSFALAEKSLSAIFLNDASDNGYAPKALFALANAYMRRGVKQGDGSFDRAAEYYKQLYEFYPGSEHAEDACRLAMIALHKSYQGSFYDDAPLNQARQLAETILKSGRGNMDVVYEELENIKEEQARRLYVLAEYYQKRGNYASARFYYNRLVRDHQNSSYATEAAQAYATIQDKPAEADQLAWVRPVMPFLPKSNREYFEEAPEQNMEEVAGREEALDQIGRDVGSKSVDASEETAETAQNATGSKLR